MTPAELAKHSAISFEAKKDSLRQMQNGDWKVAFTVQGVDMDERITRAAMGTRYIAVLVEVDDLEMPVSKQPEKEIKQNPSSEKEPATPQLAALDKSQPVGAKRTWDDMPPSQKAGIRSHDPRFEIFLQEEYAEEWREHDDSAECIRAICCVRSRSELGTDHRKTVLWNQLDRHFDAWLLKERVGA